VYVFANNLSSNHLWGWRRYHISN